MSLSSLAAQVRGVPPLNPDAQAVLDAALGRSIPARFLLPGGVPDDDGRERQTEARSVGRERGTGRIEKTDLPAPVREDELHDPDTALDVESPPKKQRAEGTPGDANMQEANEDELSNTRKGPEEVEETKR